jgi:ABC-2 type transport system ATP-binding protein
VVNHGEIVFDDSIATLRRHWGEKKIIAVSTVHPLPDLTLPGITVTKRISDYQAELELDLAVYELNKFIALVNKASTIRDLSVQEPQIEEAIKVLYKK